MKKNWLKILLCMAVVLVVMTCTALAADTDPTIKTVSGAAITYNADKTFSVSYTGADIKSDGQYVLIIVKLTEGGTTKAKNADTEFAANLFNSGDWEAVGEQTITYIDQSGSTVAFENFIPKSTAPSVVLLGGKYNNSAISPKVLGVILGKGVNISGKVTSYNGVNPVTVSLYDHSAADASKEDPYEGLTPANTITISPMNENDAGVHSSKGVTQEFALSGVSNGTYDLVITKSGHLYYAVTSLKVEDEDIDLTASANDYKNMTMLCGDFDNDGYVYISDLSALKKNWDQDTLTNALTDCDGDGFVYISDLAIFKKGWDQAAVEIAF